MTDLVFPKSATEGVVIVTVTFSFEFMPEYEKGLTGYILVMFYHFGTLSTVTTRQMSIINILHHWYENKVWYKFYFLKIYNN